jgi:signal peptidase I
MTDTNPSQELPPETKGNEFSELFKIALTAFCLAYIIRALFFQPFNIPSGSMKPTLLVGDYIFVTKFSYGYGPYSAFFMPKNMRGRLLQKGEPQRGDVIVFKIPSNNNLDFIKRIVGMPGDEIQMQRGRLYINGERVARKKVSEGPVENRFGNKLTMTHYIETLPGGRQHSIYEVSDKAALDNTERFIVPEGHYFVMGDNRDNSQDSRVLEKVGTVPLGHIIGRADRVFFSTDGTAGLLEFWQWPFATRFSRIFNAINHGDKDPEVLAKEGERK